MKVHLYALFLFFLIQCHGQGKIDKVKPSKKYTMEKFDVIKFNKNKVNGHYDFTLSNGIQVRQWESPPDYYVERTRKAGSKYETYKEYHFNTLQLITIGDEFYGFPVGVWKEYDENGSPISETNEDLPFKFSINELDSKLKKLNIFIMETQPGVSVSRNTDPTPVYIVTYPVSQDLSDLYVLVIDGITGRTISKTIRKRK